MSDTVSKEKRSEIMRKVRGSNTKPERIVRSILHRLGARFRLSSGQKLPGRPDIVLPSRRIAIFVHGCFWHQHSCTRGKRRPTSNETYWSIKLDKNIKRDSETALHLRKLGWEVVIVWECELKDKNNLATKLSGALSGSQSLKK